MSTCSRCRRTPRSTTCACGWASASIEGQIRERDEARAEYQKAAEDREAREPRRAAAAERLHDERREPRPRRGGERRDRVPADAALRRRGEVRLRFPLVVGPRYVPGDPVASAADGGGWAPDTDRVPDASQITPPVRLGSETRHNPVRIKVELDAGFPIQTIVSRYHAVLTEAWGEGRYRVRLRDPLSPADRDFELAWTPQDGKLPRSALFEETKDGARYLLLTLVPARGTGRRGEPAPARDRLRDRHVRVDGGPVDPAGPPRARCSPSTGSARATASTSSGSATRPRRSSRRRSGRAEDRRAREGLGGGAARERRDGDARRALEAALVGSDDPEARAPGGLPHRRQRRQRGRAVRRHPPAARRHAALHGRHRLRAERPLHDEGRRVRPRQLHVRRRRARGRGEDGPAVPAAREPGAHGRRRALAGRRGGRGVAAARAGPLRGRAARGERAALGPGRRPRRRSAAGAVPEEWRATLPLDGGRRGEGIGVLWARRKVDALLDSADDRGRRRGGEGAGRGPRPRAPPRHEAHEPRRGGRDAGAAGRRRRSRSGSGPDEHAPRLERRGRLRRAAADGDAGALPRRRWPLSRSRWRLCVWLAGRRPAALAGGVAGHRSHAGDRT